MKKKLTILLAALFLITAFAGCLLSDIPGITGLMNFWQGAALHRMPRLFHS